MRTNPTGLFRQVEIAALTAAGLAGAIGLGITALSLAPGAPPLLSFPGDAEILENGRANADAAIVPLAATVLNVGFFVALMLLVRALARAGREALAAPDPDEENDGAAKSALRQARAGAAALTAAMGQIGWIAIAWTLATDLVRNAIRVGLAVSGHAEGVKIHLNPDLPLIAVGVALLIAARVTQASAPNLNLARRTV